MILDGIEAERLKLFRLSQNRCRNLETEMETVLVENDLLNGEYNDNQSN